VKKAIKHNGGKAQWSLLLDSFAEELEGVVRVLEYGALKYARDNWQGDLPDPNFYRDAMFRHILADEENDAESGLPHYYHAICCILMHKWHINKDG